MLAACAPPQAAETANGPAMADEPAQAAAETGLPLPYSRGHSFASLDEYLAYLERTNGPIDLPWWREIRPGVYQQVIRMPAAQPQTATREELRQRFGFTH